MIESPFATVRLRQRETKGAGSHEKGLLMAFKLLAMAERRWRGINAPGHFLAEVEIDGGTMLIDPFYGGRVLTRDEALRQIDRGGPWIPWVLASRGGVERSGHVDHGRRPDGA